MHLKLLQHLDGACYENSCQNLTAGNYCDKDVTSDLDSPASPVLQKAVLQAISV